MKLTKISIGTALAGARFLAALAGVAEMGAREKFDAEGVRERNVFRGFTRGGNGPGIQSHRGKLRCCAGRAGGGDMAWTTLSLRARLLGSEPTTSKVGLSGVAMVRRQGY